MWVLKIFDVQNYNSISITCRVRLTTTERQKMRDIKFWKWKKGVY